ARSRCARPILAGSPKASAFTRGSAIEQLDRVQDLDVAPGSAEVGGELHRTPGVRACDDRRVRRDDGVRLLAPQGARCLRLGHVVDPGRTTTAITVAHLDQPQAL